MVFTIGNEQFGVMVDHVEEVMNIDEDLIKKVHENKDKPFIKGIICHDHRIITMIDIDKLIQ